MRARPDVDSVFALLLIFPLSPFDSPSFEAVDARLEHEMDGEARTDGDAAVAGKALAGRVMLPDAILSAFGVGGATGSGVALPVPVEGAFGVVESESVLSSSDSSKRLSSPNCSAIGGGAARHVEVSDAEI